MEFQSIAILCFRLSHTHKHIPSTSRRASKLCVHARTPHNITSGNVAIVLCMHVYGMKALNYSFGSAVLLLGAIETS